MPIAIIEIQGETNKSMSAVSYVMQAVLQKAAALQKAEMIQAKTAGLALALGHEAGLKGQTLEFFVNFMAQRFPDERSERYFMEWATRFISGREWANADNKSRAVLLNLVSEMKLDYGGKDERVTF